MPSNAEQQDRLDFFETVHRAYLRTEEATGSSEWFGSLGNRCIRLQAAGPAMLERLTPALAHRRTEPCDSPDLTICLWDQQSTGIALPLLLRKFLEGVASSPFVALDTRHELVEFGDERFSAVYRLGPVNILSLLDRQRSLALYFTEDATTIPYWEWGSPLQTILNWWAESRQLQYVHAAAVGTSEGAVLLTGRGGSGKSSSALACLDSPLGYIADDYCLVAAAPRPWAYSLYNTAKLIGAPDFERFPALAAWVDNQERAEADKAVLHLHRHRPDKLLAGGPIKAVAVPIVTGGADSRLKPVAAIHALRALAPTTIFQLPGTGQTSFARMSGLLRQVPCYSLELGRDIATVPPLLIELLAELG